jgi:hypothetical protein
MDGFADAFMSHLSDLSIRDSAHFPARSAVFKKGRLVRGQVVFIPRFGVNSPTVRRLGPWSGRFPIVVPYNRYRLPAFDGHPALAVWEPSASSHDWPIDSPFEFLLLLKNFLPLAVSPRHIHFVRSVFANAALLESPFLLRCCDSFLSQLATKVSRLLDVDDFMIEYVARLHLVLSREVPMPKLLEEIVREDVYTIATLLPLRRRLGSLLPEFAGSKVRRSRDTVLKLSLPSLDANKQAAGPLAHLRALTAILSPCSRLRDFPFCDLFPFWAAFQFDKPGETVEIDVMTIHDDFIADCRSIAQQLTPDHLDEVLSVVPIQALRPVCSEFWKSSTLTPFPGFSQTAFSLVAMIILHVNWTLSTLGNDVPRNLGPLQNCLHLHTVSHIIRWHILQPSNNFAGISLRINRRNIDHEIEAKKGSRLVPIVAQVAEALSRHKDDRFQGNCLPWHVVFTGEQAMDAGGPARDLLSEFTVSIFDPASGLTIPCPTSPHEFIPIPQEPEIGRMCYRAIGQVLGVIIRTGFCQHLPFAPLVWKVLADETVSESDITAVDSALGNLFRTLRTDPSFVTEWTIRDWRGSPVSVGEQRPGSTVRPNEIEHFISLCVRGRFEEIRPDLRDGRVSVEIGAGRPRTFGRRFPEDLQWELEESRHLSFLAGGGTDVFSPALALAEVRDGSHQAADRFPGLQVFHPAGDEKESGDVFPDGSDLRQPPDSAAVPKL